MNIYRCDDAEHVRQMFCGGQVSMAAFSPNGDQIVTASSESLMLWDIARGALLRSFGSPHRLFSNAAFFQLSTNAILASSYANDGQQNAVVCLWDVGTGLPAKIFGCEGLQKLLCGENGSVVLSKCGKFIFAVAEDRKAKLWDATSGECVQTFEHDEYTHVAAFLL